GAWWQYVAAIPVHDPSSPSSILNPLFDLTGVDCGVQQSPVSPVFFLVGANQSGTYHRTCGVPAGKRLFFPILNNLGFAGGWIPPFFKDLGAGPARRILDSQINAVTNADLHASVDGVAISGLTNYRPESTAFNF